MGAPPPAERFQLLLLGVLIAVCLLFWSFLRKGGFMLRPLVLGALAGLALMFILRYPLNPILQVEKGDFAFDPLTFLARAICYLVTGLAAGALARWRGALYGACAAFLPLMFNIQQDFFLPLHYANVVATRTFGRVNPGGIVILDTVLVAATMIGIAALGGHIAERTIEGSRRRVTSKERHD